MDGVFRILNAFLIERSIDAVFRAEEELELEAGNGRFRVVDQDVDGSAAMRIEPGLIGEQAQTQRSSVFGGKSSQLGEVVFFQHIDAGDDLSVAVLPTALTGDGFVVAGQRGSEGSVVGLPLHPRWQSHSRLLRGWR